MIAKTKYFVIFFFKKVKFLWMQFAHILGVVNTIILLTLVYFIIIGPFAVIAKLFGYDPLQRRIKVKITSYWEEKISTEENLKRFKYQF